MCRSEEDYVAARDEARADEMDRAPSRSELAELEREMEAWMARWRLEALRAKGTGR